MDNLEINSTCQRPRAKYMFLTSKETRGCGFELRSLLRSPRSSETATLKSSCELRNLLPSHHTPTGINEQSAHARRFGFDR